MGGSSLFHLIQRFQRFQSAGNKIAQCALIFNEPLGLQYFWLPLFRAFNRLFKARNRVESLSYACTPKLSCGIIGGRLLLDLFTCNPAFTEKKAVSSSQVFSAPALFSFRRHRGEGTTVLYYSI